MTGVSFAIACVSLRRGVNEIKCPVPPLVHGRCCDLCYGHKTLRVTIHLAAIMIYKLGIRRAPRVPREPHDCPYGNVPGHPTQPAASAADRVLGARGFVHA